MMSEIYSILILFCVSAQFKPKRLPVDAIWEVNFELDGKNAGYFHVENDGTTTLLSEIVGREFL